MKYSLDGVDVETDGSNYWIAPSATVVGKVRLETNASIWWNAIVRGDNELITIGENSNVQDGCILHTDPGFPLTIGRNVTIGHMVMLHGCTIGEGSLIGIGSVILNGAKIGRNCLIGAKTLIGEGKQIPDESLVLGIPGRVLRSVTKEQAERVARGTLKYVANWQRYRDGLKKSEA